MEIDNPCLCQKDAYRCANLADSQKPFAEALARPTASNDN